MHKKVVISQGNFYSLQPRGKRPEAAELDSRTFYIVYSVKHNGLQSNYQHFHAAASG